MVYRFELDSSTTVAAYVIGRDVDPAVHVIQNGACIASGDRSATVTVSAGTLTIVVDAGASDGSFVVVVEAT